MGCQYHWFAGDGMIHAFHLKMAKYLIEIDGPKPQMEAERKAGRSLVNPLNPMEPDPIFDYEGDDGTANTNIIFHATNFLP